MKKRALVLVAALCMALTGLTALPAAAFPECRIACLAFDGVSIEGDTASVGLRWNESDAYAKYEVFIGTTDTDLAQDAIRVEFTTEPHITIDGLTKGERYFFQLRAYTDDGYRTTMSSRINRLTPTALGTGTPRDRTVMTWNLCSQKSKCGRSWAPARRTKFLSTIKLRQPSVLALQESIEFAKTGVTSLPGYRRAAYFNSKAIYVRNADYVIETTGRKNPGWSPGHLDRCRQAPHARYGCIALGDGKYAVWVEVKDRSSGRRVIYVSTHLIADGTAKGDNQRYFETQRMYNGIRAINPHRRTVVFAGDFNSTASRPHDKPYTLMSRLGYADAFDLAARYTNRAFTSYNHWSTTPRFVPLGHHVDRVFVKPGTALVERWSNATFMAGRSTYSAPLVSDHSPVMVQLSLD